jgi:hypothetical protein
MESWYGMLWKHKNRHHELLKQAERQRLANQLLNQERSPANPPDAGAGRAADPSPLRPAPAGSLRPA